MNKNSQYLGNLLRQLHDKALMEFGDKEPGRCFLTDDYKKHDFE
jgi:hypothetical protein